MKYVLAALAVFSLFSLQAFSDDNYYFHDSQGDHILVTYQNNHKWVLDHFLIKPGSLQEKISSSTFVKKESLNQGLATLLSSKTFTRALETNNQFYVSTESKEVIWEVTNNWDLSWENKFATWLETHFDKKFFIKYNISTDCADVAYALRWIFSRINHLPVVSTLAGSLVEFSQNSMKKEWESLKTDADWSKDERFLAALNYVLQNAYTGTLIIDTYPIEISRDAFKVGTINLTGGHTMVISKIDYTSSLSAPIWKLSSTVPSQVRELFEEMVADQSNVDISQGGFLRMRWPVFLQGKWTLNPKKNMPYYSEEQFSEEFLDGESSFSIALFKKLGISFDPSKIIDQAISDIKAMLAQRVSIVEQGYNFCLKNSCEEGSFNYEEHSTPTRDGRIYEKFLSSEKLVFELGMMDSSLESKWNSSLETEIFAVEGVSHSLKVWKDYFGNHLVSSHPSDTISERWGLTYLDIKSQLQKNISRRLKLRQALVTNNTCVQDPKACDFKSSEWEKNQTYDFDEKSLALFSGYHHFCHISKIDCNDKVIPESLKRLPFMISDPKASEAERKGQQVDLSRITFLPETNKVKVLGNNYYIIDDGLFNSKESTISLQGQDLFFDAISGNLLSLNDKVISAFNIFSEKTISYEFKNSSSGLSGLSKVSDGIYLVDNCFSLVREYTCESYLITIDENSISFVREFHLTPGGLFSEKNNFQLLESKPQMITTADLHNLLIYDYQGNPNIFDLTEAANDVLDYNQYVLMAFDNELMVFDKVARKIVSSESFPNSIGFTKTHDKDVFIITFQENNNEIHLVGFIENLNFTEMTRLSGWLTLSPKEGSTLLETNSYGEFARSVDRKLLLNKHVKDLSQYQNLNYIERSRDWLSFVTQDGTKLIYENILSGSKQTSTTSDFISFCSMPTSYDYQSPKCSSKNDQLASRGSFYQDGTNILTYKTITYFDESDLFKKMPSLLSYKENLMTSSDIILDMGMTSVPSSYLAEGSLIKLSDTVFIHIK